MGIFATAKKMTINEYYMDCHADSYRAHVPFGN